MSRVRVRLTSRRKPGLMERRGNPVDHVNINYFVVFTVATCTCQSRKACCCCILLRRKGPRVIVPRKDDVTVENFQVELTMFLV